MRTTHVAMVLAVVNLDIVVMVQPTVARPAHRQTLTAIAIAMRKLLAANMLRRQGWNVH